MVKRRKKEKKQDMNKDQTIEELKAHIEELENKKEKPITNKEESLTKEEFFNYLNQIFGSKQQTMQQIQMQPNLTTTQDNTLTTGSVQSQDPGAAAIVQNPQLQQTPGNTPQQQNIPPQNTIQQPQMQQNPQQIPQQAPPQIKLTQAQEKRIIADQMIKLHKNIMILGLMFFIIPIITIFVTMFDPIIAMMIVLVSIIYPALCFAKSIKMQEYLGNKYQLKTISFIKKIPQKRYNQGVELF